jgi:hypothetical protein
MGKKGCRVEAARNAIFELRETGKGMQMNGSRGTFWGLLNAVLEYVDRHHKLQDSDSRLSYALLGEGMDLKTRAFALIQKGVMASKRLDNLRAGRGVPQPRHPVRRRGDDALAVGAERRAHYKIRMAFKRLTDGLAGLGIP